MPYEITQCYLPPDRGENPAFTPSRSRYVYKSTGLLTWLSVERCDAETAQLHCDWLLSTADAGSQADDYLNVDATDDDSLSGHIPLIGLSLVRFLLLHTSW